LKEKGVVLVDVSPVAIYTPSEKIHRTNTKTGKPYWTKEGLRLKDYDKIVQQGWQHYAAPILHELRPKKVLFLGKKVVSAIQDSTIKLHAEYLGAEVLPPAIHLCKYTQRFTWPPTAVLSASVSTQERP
jgi:hypothetical protein